MRHEGKKSEESCITCKPYAHTTYYYRVEFSVCPQTGPRSEWKHTFDKSLIVKKNSFRSWIEHEPIYRCSCSETNRSATINLDLANLYLDFLKVAY